MSHKQQRAWCALIRDQRWSAREKRILLQSLGRPELIFDAAPSHLASLIGTRKGDGGAPASNRQLDADEAWLERPNHCLITRDHAAYPEQLAVLSDPPIALFAIGRLDVLAVPKVAMVGSRRPTPVGKKIATDLAAGLAQLGVVVVSGMALGIDGLAHSSALCADGESIAVLGSGLDCPTPTRHRDLFAQLCERGLVVSEYPPGSPATRYTFPERNRLVSGLSLGVIIVEAADRSGTLITARLATEQNREVMVVPGSALSSQYAGSHALIQQGAALVLNVSDVLGCLSAELSEAIPCKVKASQAGLIDLPADCVDLLCSIDSRGSSVNDIILASGLTAAEVSSMLITLELNGTVAIDADGRYVNLS